MNAVFSITNSGWVLVSFIIQKLLEAFFIDCINGHHVFGQIVGYVTALVILLSLGALVVVSRLLIAKAPASDVCFASSGILTVADLYGIYYCALIVQCLEVGFDVRLY